MSDNSKLWEALASSKFASIDDAFLADFRAPGAPAQRTNAWDPFEKSTRYYKFLLFKVAHLMGDQFFDLHGRLRNTLVGQPPTVRVRGQEITCDYLMATEEFLFISNAVPVMEIRRVVEIGAGFGRTCHAFTTFLPDLESYTIVDLPEMLELSRAYLRKTQPEAFEKIRFVDWRDRDQWADVPTDLVININSFQEMSEQTIRAYLDFVDRQARFFYVKNPVCKYKPSVMGLDVDEIKLYDAFSLGLCREVADIYDDRDLERCRIQYTAAYMPAERWGLVSSQPQALFMHVQHAVYECQRD